MLDDNWIPPHSHDPNPVPPNNDPALMLHTGSEIVRLTPCELASFPQFMLPHCYIVSTGHGTTGPFTFQGIRIIDLVTRYAKFEWARVDIISDDGFGTRLLRRALETMGDRPAILALMINGRPLRRDEGLVRLVVPDEKEDALQQVKWVSEIRVY